MNKELRNNIFKNASIFVGLLILFFIPFYSEYDYGVSLFLCSAIISAISEFGNRPEILTSYIKFSIISTILYLFVFTLQVVGLFYKKGKYRFPFNIAAIGIICLYFITEVIIRSTWNLYEFYPSWAFYLSIIFLITYALSPLYYKKLIKIGKVLLAHIRKTFAGFRSKHPTKAERIAELEREVKQLKSQDESTDISSNNEKGSD